MKIKVLDESGKETLYGDYVYAKGGYIKMVNFHFISKQRGKIAENMKSILSSKIEKNIKSLSKI